MNTNEKPVSEALKRFQEDLEKDKEEDKKLENFKKKKLLVDDYKITNELEAIRKNEEDISKTSKVNVGIMTDEVIAEVQANSRTYFDGAKNGMTFLHELFRKWVPCWAGNIILVGACTGGGKSSVAANIIYSTIQQKNLITGKNRKVLCISAEETPVQVFGRLTCLMKDYNFDDQDEFTDQQKKDMVDFIPLWAKNGVSVIGEDGYGNTSTLEGIESILKNLKETNTHYDLILFDYIQKADTSKKNPQLPSYTVLKKVMTLFDDFKNEYPGAIVVLSQLKAKEEGKETPFQDRIRGCKDIMTPCTVALELVPNFELLKSTFWVWKNRYKSSVIGRYKHMGYDRGKFVDYTTEFEANAIATRDLRVRNSTYGKPKEESKPEGNKE